MIDNRKGMWCFFDTACPANCKDGTCDQSSGACPCEDGYFSGDCSKGTNERNILKRRLFLYFLF